MKTCSLCRTVYTDDTLNFCLNDGSVLVVDDSAATVPDFQFPKNAPIQTESVPENISTETLNSPFPIEKTVQSQAKTVEIKSTSSLPITLPSSPRRKYPSDTSSVNDNFTSGNSQPQFQFDISDNQSKKPQGNFIKYLLFALPVLIACIIGGWWIFAYKDKSVIESNAQSANRK